MTGRWVRSKGRLVCPGPIRAVKPPPSRPGGADAPAHTPPPPLPPPPPLMTARDNTAAGAAAGASEPQVNAVATSDGQRCRRSRRSLRSRRACVLGRRRCLRHQRALAPCAARLRGAEARRSEHTDTSVVSVPTSAPLARARERAARLGESVGAPPPRARTRGEGRPRAPVSGACGRADPGAHARPAAPSGTRTRHAHAECVEASRGAARGAAQRERKASESSPDSRSLLQARRTTSRLRHIHLRAPTLASACRRAASAHARARGNAHASAHASARAQARTLVR